MPSPALLGKNSQTLTTCGNRRPPRMLYEAVEVRQAAALCEDSAIRKRNLDTLDAETTRSTTSSPSSASAGNAPCRDARRLRL